jgi:hypothetical protein
MRTKKLKFRFVGDDSHDHQMLHAYVAAGGGLLDRKIWLHEQHCPKYENPRLMSLHKCACNVQLMLDGEFIWDYRRVDEEEDDAA